MSNVHLLGDPAYTLPDPGPKPLVDEHLKADRWVLPDDVQAALDEAKSLKAVVDAADYEYAVDVAKRLTQAKKAAEAWYKPLKQRFDRLKGAILTAETEDALGLEKERTRVAKLAADWHAAETERERVAKEAADKAAREKQEAERAAQVARLERAADRVPDEAVADAIRTEAEQLAAERLPEPKGDFVSNIPATKGFVPSRVTYSARCDNLPALVRAVAGPGIAREIRAALAAGQPGQVVAPLETLLRELETMTVPIEAVEASQKRLNQAATDSKEALRWPGVTVLKSGSPVVRG